MEKDICQETEGNINIIAERVDVKTHSQQKLMREHGDVEEK